MRAIISILTFIFSAPLLCGQTVDKQVKSDTIVYSSSQCKDCPVILDTVVYKLLGCGLYKGSNGDIGYRSSEIYNDNFDRRTRYITWIYGADQKDTLNGGLKEMKYVIDTSSFRFLSNLYWADKNNIYGFTPTSDGGTIFLNTLADKKSFRAFEATEYAKDKNSVYYHNSIIEGADPKTFEVINHKDISELACDKLYIYRFGERLTDKEINEWKLEKYRK
jgi:hypothetical protein